MLKKCMKDMDSIGVSGSIGDFEKVFEDLDVKVEEMNGALDGVYSSSMDNGEVTDLLAELGSQQHMEEKDKMGAVAGGNIVGVPSSAQANDVDEMQARINQLKNL